jgi:hypothetical protein
MTRELISVELSAVKRTALDLGGFKNLQGEGIYGKHYMSL